MHVTVRFDERTATVIAIAAEDNLVKGASGQMIQAANIVLGMPETTGLVTWTIFSLGLALIGTFIYATYREPVDPLDSYRNAQALIRELIGLSDNLYRWVNDGSGAQ